MHAAPLCFPAKILLQHVAVLGKTGAGKSSALRHIAEHLLTHGKRVCIVDPKGDWWGLKSSADGKGAGYPVIAFGEFKDPRASNVPINAHSGKHVAELIATGNRPAIIGFRGWMPGAMTRFWIDFASTLFNTNGGELYLFIDEVHNFAAKGKIMDPEAGKCLHWTNRIMAEGRGVGLVCMIASQRPQKVHNDTLTCCETLVAMRVNHPADRAASADWIDGCGDPKRGAEVLNNLAALPRGEAYVWSPEIGFGPQRVKFPMFETFDSFAPPQLQRKVSESGWADIDLGAVTEKLAAVIEEAKANDPKELRAEIARLRSELAKKPTATVQTAAPIEIKVPDVAALTRLKDRLDEVDSSLNAIREPLNSQLEKLERIRTDIGMTAATIIREITQRPATPRAAYVAPKPAARTPVATAAPSDGSLTGTQQKIIDVILMLGVRGIEANRDSVARWLDIHPKGGRYGSDLAALRADNYLDGCMLTDRGAAAAHPMDTGLDATKGPLDGTQQTIIDVLSETRDITYTRDTLAEKLGIHPKGGRYGSDLARLRTMGLIPERGDIHLTEAAYR